MDSSNQWGNSNPWDQPDPSPTKGSGGTWGSNTSQANTPQHNGAQPNGVQGPLQDGPQGPPPGSPGGPNQSGGSSPKGPIIAVIVVIVLVIAAGVGFYLLNRDSSGDDESASRPSSAKPSGSATAEPAESEAPETTAESEESAAPSKGSCEQAKADADMHRPVSSYCDGQWALIGNYGSDHTELYYWTGDSWGTYEPDGNHSSGAMSPCYERSKLVDAQAPEKLVDEMYQGHQLCNDTPVSSGGDSSGSQQNNAADSDLPPGGDWLPYLPCQGNYALIVDSVVVYPGQNPRPLVRKSLAANPGTESTYPGACAAFRSHVDGADVYPIYIDYGSDLAGVCAAESRGEGNARKLQQVADYSSPC